jgi:hypothetical protein
MRKKSNFYRKAESLVCDDPLGMTATLLAMSPPDVAKDIRDSNLVNDVHRHLKHAPGVGESISFVMSGLRDQGYRLPIKAVFATELERLGFTVEHVSKKGSRSIRMTLVRVPAMLRKQAD